MLERLARWCFRRRRLVLVLWIVGFITFGAFGSSLNGGYSQSTDLPGSDAVAAFNLLKDRFPQQSGDSVLVAFKADRGIDDPAVRPRLDALTAELARQRTHHREGVVAAFAAPRAEVAGEEGARFGAWDGHRVHPPCVTSAVRSASRTSATAGASGRR